MKSTEKVEVKCAICGKVEYVFPSRAKRYKTCSIKCMGAHNRIYNKQLIKTCPYCGKEFKVKPSHFERRKYCSIECMRSDLPRKYAGSGNPNYKGLSVNSDGYQVEKNNSKYTIHRETVKNVLNIKCIPSSLVVHHKDGNKHSNDPRNLILLTHKQHAWLHKNIGNFAFKALYSNKLTVDEILSWVEDKHQKEFVRYALTTDCTQQSAVVKQGELLENPDLDDQQPSLISNGFEGSTTNARCQ